MSDLNIFDNLEIIVYDCGQDTPKTEPSKYHRKSNLHD